MWNLLLHQLAPSWSVWLCVCVFCRWSVCQREISSLTLSDIWQTGSRNLDQLKTVGTSTCVTAVAVKNVVVSSSLSVFGVSFVFTTLKQIWSRNRKLTVDRNLDHLWRLKVWNVNRSSQLFSADCRTVAIYQNVWHCLFCHYDFWILIGWHLHYILIMGSLTWYHDSGLCCSKFINSI